MIRVYKPDGTPAAGATVTITAPPAFGLFGGFSAQGTTDANGVWNQPEPSFWNLPLGSTADVKAIWYDYIQTEANLSPIPYYASGTLTVVPDWNVLTGFEGWSPNPLDLYLQPASPQEVQNFQQTQQTEQTGGGQVSLTGIDWNKVATYLILGGIGIVALYVILKKL